MAGTALSAFAAGWALAATVLEGIALLPADTRMPGPRSGHFIPGLPLLEPPFDGQPLQGISSVAAESPDSLFVLTDNGFGRRDNSADFLLRVYALAPDFRTAVGGTGRVQVNGFITLKDPLGKLGYERVAGRDTYTGRPSDPPVDPSLALQQWLTGADLDPESMARHPDGSFWIGDEFGPYVLHFDAVGRLLEPPHALPRLSSPDRPDATDSEATVARSRGFEGMAMSPDGAFLYPMLEAGLERTPGVLQVYTFDVEQRRFLNADAWQPSFRYRLGAGASAIGEFVLYTDRRGLVIERDSGEGSAAAVKKVYDIDLAEVGEDGFLAKAERVDLLHIEDPHDLDGDGETVFAFPFQTIESLVVFGPDRLLVVNDNNYPFGRARQADRPDATEFILLRVAEPW